MSLRLKIIIPLVGIKSYTPNAFPVYHPYTVRSFVVVLCCPFTICAWFFPCINSCRSPHNLLLCIKPRTSASWSTASLSFHTSWARWWTLNPYHQWWPFSLWSFVKFVSSFCWAFKVARVCSCVCMWRVFKRQPKLVCAEWRLVEQGRGRSRCWSIRGAQQKDTRPTNQSP